MYLLSINTPPYSISRPCQPHTQGTIHVSRVIQPRRSNTLHRCRSKVMYIFIHYCIVTHTKANLKKWVNLSASCVIIYYCHKCVSPPKLLWHAVGLRGRYSPGNCLHHFLYHFNILLFIFCLSLSFLFHFFWFLLSFSVILVLILNLTYRENEKSHVSSNYCSLSLSLSCYSFIFILFRIYDLRVVKLINV